MNSLLIPLKTEYDTDPLGRGYASMSADEAAADLNERRYSESVEYWITDRWLDHKLGLSRSVEIMTVLETANTSLSRRACELLKDRASGGIDVGSPETQNAIDLLALGGILTAAEAEKIKAFGVIMKSRAEQIGYSREISAEWILRVRGE